MSKVEQYFPTRSYIMLKEYLKNKTYNEVELTINDKQETMIVWEENSAFVVYFRHEYFLSKSPLLIADFYKEKYDLTEEDFENIKKILLVENGF